MTVSQELEHVTRVVQDVEELEALHPAVGDDSARKRIQRIRHRRLGDARAVRLRVAAKLLGLSVPTVRAWTDRGLLVEVPDEPIRRVTLESVLRVRPDVAELRELGRHRHLLAAVLARADDREALSDPALTKSLEQLRRGEVTNVPSP